MRFCTLKITFNLSIGVVVTSSPKCYVFITAILNVTYQHMIVLKYTVSMKNLELTMK